MLISFIFYLSIFLIITLIFSSLFSHSYKYPLLIYLLASPIVDASWSRRYEDFSIIHIFNIAFIFIFIIKMLIKKEKLYKFPYFKLFLFYFLLNFFVTANIYLNKGLISSLDFFARAVFMPLSVFLFYQYFGKHSDGKKLITVLIISGLFPLIFVLGQKFTGYIWFYRQTRGIVRNVGLYHDAVTPRIFLIQALIGIFIYWHFFLKSKKNMFLKLLLIITASLVGVGLYYLYSKAIFLTVIVWLLIFTILKRKMILIPVLIILTFLSVNYFKAKHNENEIHQVFSKEVDFLEGKISSDYVLSGRGGIWKIYIRKWKNFSFIDKILGIGVSHGYFHNDFLRILFSGGLFLLITYLYILVVLIIKVLKGYIYYNKFLSFIALLCICYFIIESIGQVAGLYPHIQIFVWGIVGLSINEKLEWGTIKLNKPMTGIKKRFST